MREVLTKCVNVDYPDMITLCQEFAKRGFVVFNVSYREGVIVDRREVPNGFPPGITFTTAQQMLAFYRACQDARGVIRTIINRQIDNLNVGFQIDIDKIFLGGMSAGSAIALNAAYYQSQQMVDDVFPDVSNALGPVDQPNYYDYGSTNFDYFTSIKGVINCWGSMNTPATNQYWTNPFAFFAKYRVAPIPIISFHGKDDLVFNYVRQLTYFSTVDILYGDLFRTESDCVDNTYTVPGSANDVNPDLITLGSQKIYEMLKGQNIASEFYLDCTMGHGLDNCPEDPQECPFDSDFGTHLTTRAAVYSYIAGRGATFFQAILGNVANSLGDSKFVECENYRATCNAADSNDGCCDTDSCTNLDCQ